MLGGISETRASSPVELDGRRWGGLCTNYWVLDLDLVRYKDTHLSAEIPIHQSFFNIER